MPALRLVIAAETPVAAVPEPALFVDVFEPYEALGPYWKYQLVELPCGLTEPVSVAPLVEAPWAEPVCTTGGPALPKVRSLPVEVPAVLEQETRKW